MPQRSAVSASIASPSIARARARASPTRWVRKKLAPLSGTRPMRMKAWTKRRGPGGQHDVAGQGEAGAGAGGDAIDRADERQAGGPDAAHDLMVIAVGQGLQVGRAVRAGHEIGPEFLARAEAASFPGQHHRAAVEDRPRRRRSRPAAWSACRCSGHSAWPAGSGSAGASRRAARPRISLHQLPAPWARRNAAIG